MANSIKKEIVTNPQKQNKLLFLVYQASLMIKQEVKVASLNNTKENDLRKKITAIVLGLSTKLPKDIKDRDSYLIGLIREGEMLIERTYKPIIRVYYYTTGELIENFGIEKKAIDTPLKAFRKIREIQEQSPELWATAKGVPYIQDYDKLVRQRMTELAKTEPTPTLDGKKKLSIWQKAELDVRYEAQMKMLDDKRSKIGSSGKMVKTNIGTEIPIEQLQWTSSHPNASKDRCAKWQGKLYDIIGYGEGKSHKMPYKVGGRVVYSLTDVMNIQDKYGNVNSIISGYNCRHHLIDYIPNQLPPQHFNQDDIERQNIIEAKIRYMERKIRQVSEMAMAIREIDPIRYKELKAKVKKMVADYKAFCTKYGYSWSEYRI